MGAQQALLGPLSGRDPDRIGSYVLLGQLGAGSMGRVYLGRSAAGRLVAVKTIKPEYAEEPDFRARFTQEVAAARRVSGVFTAAVVAADPDAGVPWLATAYVPAPSLDRLVRACGPLPVPAVRWLAAGCAEALESIHGAGLVHRDLKPSNVLVSLDGPRVIDFGVARAVERIQLTSTHGAVGTPAYMAPEQARNTRQVAVASDVFSLGSTLLYAGSGHAPYRGETVMDILIQLATEPPDLSGLPPELTDLVAACLDRDPQRRPTPAVLLAELAPYVDLETEHGSEPSVLPAAGLALIQEYRKRPQATARIPEPTGPDATLASRPGSLTSHPGPLASDAMAVPTTQQDAAAASAASPGVAEAAGRRRFALPARQLPRPSAPPGGRGNRRPGKGRAGEGRSPTAKEPRFGQAAMIIISIGTVAALLIAGGILGARSSSRANQTQNSQNAYNGYDPRLLGPGPPLSGASDRPGGRPQLLVNQPMGDGATGFVVHGRGWVPNQLVTVALAGGRVSGYQQTIDLAGTFNYTINQSHEFFTGPIPPGHYTVVATATDGSTAHASFDVHP
ncbi:serine/threonine-protein kinase [Frankia sp. Cj5]|uniref:serine/threonine protein kinase n=1 Tax=Frankia sp. Cj5 TaxID=2880978 RepID=UPI001EF735A7|nr:serine/threonine-protein kinase [Frankia sp. Cj5]